MLFRNWLSAVAHRCSRRSPKARRRQRLVSGPSSQSRGMFAAPSITEKLEDRTLLSAFSEVGTTLTIDIDTASESVSMVSSGTTYTLVTNGTFTGTDSANVMGTASNTLT
ncbi:MAG: hypothetical protein O3B13_25880, partial [Planctomycetota bacterium]|nr:hypothetical protein [Planctomycetota bacterium]